MLPSPVEVEKLVKSLYVTKSGRGRVTGKKFANSIVKNSGEMFQGFLSVLRLVNCFKKGKSC